MRYKKNKANRRNQKVYFHAETHRCAHRKNENSKYTQKINSYRILECTVFCSGQVKCC